MHHAQIDLGSQYISSSTFRKFQSKLIEVLKKTWKKNPNHPAPQNFG